MPEGMPGNTDKANETALVNKDNKMDIVIIGGGIAGLWTLARLRNLGYQAILVEAESLGCVQSGASQGIIHGGTKYALSGKLTHSAQSIQQMPQRWKACLEGVGEVDLSQAQILSEHQYLWSNKSLASKLTGFFASKVMSSRMQHLSSDEYVAPFNQPGFAGELYQLDESVLDIQSVIETIRAQFSEFILQARIETISHSLRNEESGAINTYQIQSADGLNIFAQCIVLTAGAGNEKLLASLNLKEPEMQRRPLLMPMLKAKESVLPRMYAHCLGASALPKMTITAHSLSAGVDNQKQRVWYLGGEIAEKGVGRSVEEQTRIAKQELQSLMPWMDFCQCQWSALAIDRAEPKMPDGSRPIEPAVFTEQGIITAWPVKLAMAPIMADKVLAEIENLKIKKKTQSVFFQNKNAASMTRAKTTQLPWEKVENWL
ncbi:MAG: FAD-dependent oxidoreductase [gamma proteobacterium symbiont of Bathyaustriella thionipta]|nr:FAD-dependent oxidoreductase [gamma proteobacterium symbiont of Bathyaustriella thionipta]MCU7955886.1 FAD-dependent oxidoreductase [gamma proteobacterium symbiont of Bathyaustriella thionipta]